MPTRQPNVIVVLADQLRAFELGCYGNRYVPTPHLDALAAEGARFDLAVTNNPVCTPARSCLLTGQYSRRCTGELGNVADDPPCRQRRRLLDCTVAESFRAAGYRTALIGKWHVDPDPRLVGFDEAYYPLTVHRYQGQRYFANGELQAPVPGFAPDHEWRQVESWLDRAGQAPGFLLYSIGLPHNPIGPAELPADVAPRMERGSVHLRPNVWRDGKMACSETWFKTYCIWDYFWRMGGPCWNAAPICGYPDPIGELPSDALPDGFDLSDLTALYDAASRCVDTLVGRLIAGLRRRGLQDDTILLFTSDHGDNLGSHHLFNKDCLYEESIRIPFLLRAPGRVPVKAHTRQVAQLIDIMPTLLDLCGLPVPATVDGRSLVPVLRGETDELPDNWAFIETDPFHFGRPTVGIRTPDRLLGCYLDPATRELAELWGHYDLDRDPFQTSNLTAGGMDAEVLQARLNRWNRTTPWLRAEGSGRRS